MMDAITFWAAVQKVQTLADGGIRVTLDLPEQCIMQMAELAACKVHGRILDVSVTEHAPDTPAPRGEWELPTDDA